MSTKKILVFGAGVIGSTYGGFLSLAGYEVMICMNSKN